MKKLVLMLAVAFSMSFFACGNKEAAAETEAAAEETVDTVAVVEEAVVDTLVNAETGDTAVVAEVAAEVAAAPAE